MEPAPELSVVVPMYNEAQGIRLLVQTLVDTLSPHAESLEIVCVDDGSIDGSAELLRSLQGEFPSLTIVQLSRRFGKESAMWAGLSAARGRAVVVMDADLQHPPEVIGTMLAEWRRGADVVEGVKRTRGDEPMVYRRLAKLFNTIASRSLQRSLEGASDFKLLDEQVVDALRDCPERHRFFRGLVAWVGFEVVQIPFDVAPRAAGVSKWSSRQLVVFALRNLLSFTAAPLHMVAGLGALALVTSAVLAVQTLLRYLAGAALGGFTTVILLQLVLSGVLLASVGVIALYVAELHTEVKARPAYLVRRTRPERARRTATPPPASGDGP